MPNWGGKHLALESWGAAVSAGEERRRLSAGRCCLWAVGRGCVGFRGRCLLLGVSSPFQNFGKEFLNEGAQSFGAALATGIEMTESRRGFENLS